MVQRTPAPAPPAKGCPYAYGNGKVETELCSRMLEWFVTHAISFDPARTYDTVKNYLGHLCEIGPSRNIRWPVFANIKTQKISPH